MHKLRFIVLLFGNVINLAKINFQKEANILSKCASDCRQSDHDHFVEKVSNIQYYQKRLLFLCIYNGFCAL
jgi:hypothetical protein